jgi:hypothetical protein
LLKPGERYSEAGERGFEVEETFAPESACDCDGVTLEALDPIVEVSPFMNGRDGDYVVPVVIVFGVPGFVLCINR